MLYTGLVTPVRIAFMHDDTAWSFDRDGEILFVWVALDLLLDAVLVGDIVLQWRHFARVFVLSPDGIYYTSANPFSFD